MIMLNRKIAAGLGKLILAGCVMDEIEKGSRIE